MNKPENIDSTLGEDSVGDLEDTRKPWVDPALKILPVPGYTKGGAFDFEDHDNKNLYNIS